ncbi:MAG: class I SAM-dependent RNA methyltransferase [Oscillospiraceae bacterium]|nr:class I SAM-dependent RNA methyltransferase [Oscillospiraceae bacterium]
MDFTLCAPCLFGLESPLGHEIKRIGGKDVIAADGKVTFKGDYSLLARANISLRTAERVCVVLGSFMATSFTELFDEVAKLPFEEWIGRSDAFPVKGWSLKSQLHSIPDCQKIIKRAIVRRFEAAYGQTWFEESGPVHQIQFSILKDEVTVMLDTSGQGLHKRGYRKGTGIEAPIKETLAAGIADLAHVKADSVVIDPMCGSGTFLIESALRACKIPPGAGRPFAAENWGVIPKEVWKAERQAAMAEVDTKSAFAAQGWDIDPTAAATTLENARKAGIIALTTARQQDISAFVPDREKAIVLCNPPYGERLLEIKAAEELYRRMGQVFVPKAGYSYYIISPHEQFESLFGRKATKRRKLYNGMIKCQLFMYF